MLVAQAKNPEFLNASMGSAWYNEFINVYVAGGNGAIGNLNKADLDKFPIKIPSFAEQQQLGAYFSSLDRQITLHSQRLSALRQVKSACLDKMFA